MAASALLAFRASRASHRKPSYLATEEDQSDMILIPYARLEGGTSLSPSEVAERMRQFLGDVPPPQVHPSPLPMPMRGKRYEGRVDEGSFQLKALSNYRVGYLPSFKGDLIAEYGHTRVRGVVAASRAETVALAVGVVVFAALMKSFVVVGMGLAAHAGWHLFGFLPHRNTFEAWLEDLPEWEWTPTA
jgi:hypothetical protein